jgi:hypothetical protein
MKWLKSMVPKRLCNRAVRWRNDLDDTGSDQGGMVLV